MASKRKQSESPLPERIEVHQMKSSKLRSSNSHDVEEGESENEYPKEDKEEEFQVQTSNDEERLEEMESATENDEHPNDGYVCIPRSADGTEEKSIEESWKSKKKKKKKKKRRIFKEEDELWILRGLYEFGDMITTDLASYLDELYNLVSPYLSTHVSVVQLKDKVGNLKEKYRKNVQRGEHGKDPNFSNPHEEKLFSLSKNIWGTASEVYYDPQIQEENQEDTNHEYQSHDDNNTQGDNQDNNTQGDNQEDDHNQDDHDEIQGMICWPLYPRLSESLQMDDFLLHTLTVSGYDNMKEMLSYIGSSKAEELEEKWRKLQVEETRVKLMRAKLIQEQTELIFNFIK